MAQAADVASGSNYAKLVDLGDKIVGAFGSSPNECRRQMTKYGTGEPLFKDNGKPAYELVVYLLTLRSTMEAGIGGEDRVPERGEVVRAILKGKTFGRWIDEKDKLGRGIQVGDLFRLRRSLSGGLGVETAAIPAYDFHLRMTP